MREQIQRLRALMERSGVDNCIVTTTDAHNSEYVSAHDRVLEYMSGFTGSNGTLLVTQTEALLWTDGRYYIQCEKELAGSGISMMRQGDDRDPSIDKYLGEHLKAGDSIGINGYNITKHQEDVYMSKCDLEVKTCATGDISSLREQDPGANTVYMVTDADLAGRIWDEDESAPRPVRPARPIYEQDIDYAGRTVSEKLSDVRAAMSEAASAHVLSSLPDIMWLYNIRGGDIRYNPIAFSYSYITPDHAYLFVQNGTVDHELADRLKISGVIVCDYDGFADFLMEQDIPGKVLLDERETSVRIYNLISDKAEIINKVNPTTELKAVKNDAEIAAMKEFFLRDSYAMTAYIYAVKKIMGCSIPYEMEALFADDKRLAEIMDRYRGSADGRTIGSVTDNSTDNSIDSGTGKADSVGFDEFKAGMLCDEIRLATEGCTDLSFGTIAAYGPNAAMMHYEATESSHAGIEPHGMLLTDCGGQYPGATTDVTRTIALGRVSDEEKHDFTLVLKGWLALMHATWLEGCTGRNLDILARQYLWNEGIDYKCGTGHGVGCCLSVHEGPQNIRWRYIEGSSEAILRPGMTVTNEPGVYREGKYGIRT
ncbi:MAG: aminopeptidase P family N-terminal domain-containing protein, partial [Lachnospiraceae bacterium]|nr:aminopeptidase P family N-terminal domain-containing protein [Lachnospiraceae bacterium]